MSETATSAKPASTQTDAKPREKHDNKGRDKRPKKTVVISDTDTVDLKTWLSNLEMGGKNPVHINGHHYPTAVVTVDLGLPVKGNKLTSDQSNELNQRLKKLTREVIGKDVAVRVNSDSNNGIYWTSVA